MNHPNAFAAAVAGGSTIAAQWLIQRYAHASLSEYWKDAITAGVTVGVLWVGRNGLRAAFGRILNGPKKIWSGSPAPAPAPAPPPPAE